MSKQNFDAWLLRFHSIFTHYLIILWKHNLIYVVSNGTTFIYKITYDHRMKKKKKTQNKIIKLISLTLFHYVIVTFCISIHHPVVF